MAGEAAASVGWWQHTHRVMCDAAAGLAAALRGTHGADGVGAIAGSLDDEAVLARYASASSVCGKRVCVDSARTAEGGRVRTRKRCVAMFGIGAAGCLVPRGMRAGGSGRRRSSFMRRGVAPRFRAGAPGHMLCACVRDLLLRGVGQSRRD